jgi:hypothetical protein
MWCDLPTCDEMRRLTAYARLSCQTSRAPVERILEPDEHYAVRVKENVKRTSVAAKNSYTLLVHLKLAP